MTQTQYYKNTIDIAIAKYQAGAMNAIGLLFDYIKVKFRPDWRITLNPKKVCQELGISNSTFYRSLKKVGQLLNKTIHIRTEKVFPTSENPSSTSRNLVPPMRIPVPRVGMKIFKIVVKIILLAIHQILIQIYFRSLSAKESKNQSQRQKLTPRFQYPKKRERNFSLSLCLK